MKANIALGFALSIAVAGSAARLFASAPTTCGNLNMVWRDATNAVIRSEAYTCGTDTCGGKRCVVGNEISPACYDASQCAAACNGQCVDIPAAQLDCQALCGLGAAAGAPTNTPAPAPAAAVPTTFGALSNFDVFNDTGQECHGFEIELDGVSSQDVVYTFGEPYERYGNPTKVDFPGGVYVRYESPYDPATQTFTQTTPMAPSTITPTDGHACWYGGSADYQTSGCEHFGLQVNGNPTATVYRWLVADPSNPGALQPSGTKVSIPAPIWNVSPPPPAAPDQVHPVVAAVIQADPPGVFEFGDAMWVKVFKTESPEPAELDHLLTDDPAVPQEQAETEIEWTLFQSSRNKQGQLENEAQIGAGNESVTRRYEFYQYTGAYDPETHEATPQHDSAPLPEEVGNYIGAQMAAINLAPAGPACAGDCNGDGTVTIDEIVKGLNIALHQLPFADCSSLDTSGDGVVTIDELIAAVNHALAAC